MTPFNAQRGLIIVPITLDGPTGDTHAFLALDTGATTTLMDPIVLLSTGFDPSTATEHVFITAASGVLYVPKVEVNALEAMGIRRPSLKVLAMPLPPSAGIDGLLGLDFFRDKRLTIDFRKGQIDLR